MKTPLKLAILVLLSTLNPQLSTVFAQGSLTPPGAPAPMMKTLGQIEPRTPISSAPFTINAPGSYYLTTNLTVASSTAIIIATNGVTLDLSGFTIASTAPSASGAGIIIHSGLRNLTIVNGFIRGGVTNNAGTYDGPGFNYGIYYSSGTAPQDTRVAGVSVCGCQLHGIYLARGDSTVVESCTVRTVGGTGIMASTIKNSVAVDCGSSAINGDQVSDCRGESTGSGIGIYATTAHNCYGFSSSGDGVNAFTAQNCYGLSSGDQQGLYARYTAQNCYGQSVTGTGLEAPNALNCYGYSTNGDGLVATTAQNCHGQTSTGYGLTAATAQNCYGYTTNGDGLVATTAQNCHGQTSTGYGLFAATAQNCYGYTTNGTGLHADYTAENCYGHGGGSGGSVLGIYVGGTALNCRGYGRAGISCQIAQNCYGYGTSNTGIYADKIAIGCRGESGGSGTGLIADLANSCTGSSVSGTAVSVIYKYNMP